MDEGVIAQYLRHPEVSRDFAAYWVLYRKYHQDYGVEDILQGKPFDAVVARAMDAGFDERISLVSLLLAGLNTRFAAARAAGAVTDACYQQLRSFKRALGQQAGADPADLFAEQRDRYRERLEADKSAGSLLPDEAAARTRTVALLTAWGRQLDNGWTRTMRSTRCAAASTVRCSAARRLFPPPRTRWNLPLTLWSRRLRTGRRWSSLSTSWPLPRLGPVFGRERLRAL